MYGPVRSSASDPIQPSLYHSARLVSRAKPTGLEKNLNRGRSQNAIFHWMMDIHSVLAFLIEYLAMEMRRNFRFQESPKLYWTPFIMTRSRVRVKDDRNCVGRRRHLASLQRYFIRKMPALTSLRNAKNMALILYVTQVYHL